VPWSGWLGEGRQVLERRVAAAAGSQGRRAAGWGRPATGQEAFSVLETWELKSWMDCFCFSNSPWLGSFY